MTLVKEFHRVLEKDFHQNAEQCVRMAESAGDPLARDAWEQLAEKWQKLERQEAEDIDRLTSH